MKTVLTEAYQEAYKKGLALMAALPDVLQQEEHIIVNLLRDAAICFMDANKLQPEQAQPYLMLASIYLGMGKLDLVHKYIEYAEKIAPEEPALLYLKDYLASPEFFQNMGKKHQSKAPIVNADAIPKVQALLKPNTSTRPTAGNPFARLFADILPLTLSARDLQDWVKDVFEYELSDEDTLFVFEVMIGESQSDPKETTLKLQTILSRIRPELGKQISTFGRELSGSVYGQVRQAHLLLRPLAKQLPNAESIQTTLQKQFQQDLTAVEAQHLFDLIHSPLYRQPQAQIESFQNILIRIYPNADKSVNLNTFIEALGRA